MSKRLYILIINLVVVGLIGWFLVWPAWGGVSQLRGEQADLQKKIEEARQTKARLGDLKQKYENLTDEQEKIMTAVPMEEDLPGLLIQLEAMAFQNGLLLNSVNFTYPDTTKSSKASAAQTDTLPKNQQTSGNQSAVAPLAAAPPAEVKTLVVKLNLSGSYSSLKSFLKTIENDLRLTDIITIDYLSENSEGGLGQAEAGKLAVDVNVYYKK